MNDLHAGPHLGHLMAHALRRHRDAPVLHLGETTMTGGDLADEMSRYVAAFTELGIGTGSPVGLLALNRPEVLVVIGAGQMLGMRRTALHPLGSLDDHAYVLADAGIETLVQRDQSRDHGQQRAMDRVLPLEDGLAPGATVMSWRGIDGAIAAATAGHDAVLSPWPTLYFDNRPVDVPVPGRGRIVGIEDVYGFDPMPAALNESQRKHILGVQANIWTEYMRVPDRVEFMTFPRAAAVAEVAWSPAENKNWAGFAERLPAQLERYRMLGIRYAEAPKAQPLQANRRRPMRTGSRRDGCAPRRSPAPDGRRLRSHRQDLLRGHQGAARSAAALTTGEEPDR